VTRFMRQQEALRAAAEQKAQAERDKAYHDKFQRRISGQAPVTPLPKPVEPPTKSAAQLAPAAQASATTASVSRRTRRDQHDAEAIARAATQATPDRRTSAQKLAGSVDDDDYIEDVNI
jgi:hypothetical protein